MHQDDRGRELDLIWEKEGGFWADEKRDESSRPVKRRPSEQKRQAGKRRPDRPGRYHSDSEEALLRRRRIMRRKKRRRQVMIVRTVTGAAAVFILIIAVFALVKAGSFLLKKNGEKDTMSAMNERKEQQMILDNHSARPAISEDFLTPNEYSRPGDPLTEVDNIFVHYTANPNTTAAQNRSYFENLATTKETSASAHFVIGYDGEIIQCIPLDEIAYAVKQHNFNSISIECCYQREDGKFSDETWQSLIKLVGWLLKEYKLGPSAVLRHYDAGGKPCPLYYVNHEDEWKKFLEELGEYMERDARGYARNNTAALPEKAMRNEI